MSNNTVKKYAGLAIAMGLMASESLKTQNSFLNFAKTSEPEWKRKKCKSCKEFTTSFGSNYSYPNKKGMSFLCKTEMIRNC